MKNPWDRDEGVRPIYNITLFIDNIYEIQLKRARIKQKQSKFDHNDQLSHMIWGGGGSI